LFSPARGWASSERDCENKKQGLTPSPPSPLAHRHVAITRVILRNANLKVVGTQWRGWEKSHVDIDARIAHGGGQQTAVYLRSNLELRLELPPYFIQLFMRFD